MLYTLMVNYVDDNDTEALELDELDTLAEIIRKYWSGASITITAE